MVEMVEKVVRNVHNEAMQWNIANGKGRNLIPACGNVRNSGALNLKLDIIHEPVP